MCHKIKVIYKINDYGTAIIPSTQSGHQLLPLGSFLPL